MLRGCFQHTRVTAKDTDYWSAEFFEVSSTIFPENNCSYFEQVNEAEGSAKQGLWWLIIQSSMTTVAIHTWWWCQNGECHVKTVVWSCRCDESLDVRVSPKTATCFYLHFVLLFFSQVSVATYLLDGLNVGARWQWIAAHSVVVVARGRGFCLREWSSAPDGDCSSLEKLSLTGTLCLYAKLGMEGDADLTV